MLNEIGRVCVKIAGRDANKKCAIVDVVDENHVLIDGETRRRKCNTKHLEPIKEVLKIKKGASHEEVKKAFKGIGVEVFDTKPKKAVERPKRLKMKKAAPPKKEEKPVKKPVEEKKPVKEAAPEKESPKE